MPTRQEAQFLVSSGCAYWLCTYFKLSSQPPLNLAYGILMAGLSSWLASVFQSLELQV